MAKGPYRMEAPVMPLPAPAGVPPAGPSARGPLVLEARKLIEAEKNLGRRHYLFGQLDEARGELDDAVDSYATAVKAGSPKAEDRLTELLEHEECRVRSDAARAVGELQLESARGELEDLAEEGGPGDGEKSNLLDRVLGPCDSRKAAKSALERFKDD